MGRDGSIVHDLKGDEGVSHKAASKFTVTHTFDKAGTYRYQCTIHPGMTGTVTVNPCTALSERRVAP